MNVYKVIANDSLNNYNLINSFCSFKSIDNVLYVIYTNSKKTIICYNLLDYKIINIIKDAHDGNITNFRHYLDEINKKDLLMSISCEDNNIKLWNAHNWECLLNLKQIYYNGFLFSACFLHLNNDIFIITSNNNTKIAEDFSEPIKVYDISGNFIKEVEESYLKSFFIESYLDYIITGNNGYLKSYNFQENKTYQIYRDKTDNSFYSNVNTIKDKDVIKIIEFYVGGLIRIWNFHLGILLNKIKLDHAIFGNCLWNKECVLVGCYNGTIELIELKSGKKYGIYEGHNCTVINVNKIIHPLYGECIISQGIGKDKIKFLINNN